MPKRKQDSQTVLSKNKKVEEHTTDQKNSSDTICGWVTKDPVYIEYHDNEWGKPEYNSLRLFETLCLEGQQAGLSWITILKKRDHYRKLFHDFDPHKISKLTKKYVDEIVCDPGIVRHRGKLEAIIENSKCYLKMKSDGEDFSKFIWSFVNNTPIVNEWRENNEVPTQTKTSAALSNALKKRGFKFVGSTICYAFMQACGLVNDHITSCKCHVRK